ncbi:MAG TPA: AarF/UbiB family protein [Candidatus Omnitrophota bacterium]|nr:AarF/UbiB family protein [Candidatus Omnitrophota bacterium]
MFQSLNRRKSSPPFRTAVLLTILAFSANIIILPQKANAQSSLDLPHPGVRITPTSGFVPPMLKGIKVDPQQPFQFDFILDSGNLDLQQSQLKEEARKLIRYFLASLTIPEEDLWVNLSPYEKDRIIPTEFGETEMGRDLLGQDYILKQLTASLIYPEEDLGREFWARVFEKANRLYGTTEIPINTFNKVWIVPDKAVVYEKNDIAFVLESHLKVMLEEDYVSLKNNLGNKEIGTGRLQEQEVKGLSGISSSIIKEVVIPEIEKEVNEGKNFAKLRQVYHSLVLAKWYKERLKTSLLNKAYSDKKKIDGVDVDDKAVKEKIYQQYLEAFKTGVFNYIKEDYDAYSRHVIPRKYFSGGMQLTVPLEIETDPSPDQLAKADAVGKLSWIQGIYRQPRSAPRTVNDFIRKQFQSGRVKIGEPVTLEDGSSRKVYYVDDLLKTMGQLGHMGFIEKDESGQAIAGGLEVVFLDSKYGADDIVRRHEGHKISRWAEKRESLGLSPGQMREWLKGHLRESVAFLQEVDRDADRRYSLESIYASAEKRGELPSNDQIAETYTQPDDFKDLNLAAGRWGIRGPTQGIMPGQAVYSLKSDESFDDIIIKELAKQRGVSIDDLEADFERTITMLEARLEHGGFVDPSTDKTAQKIHEIFNRLIAVYKTKTSEPPGALHVIDANSVNAFVIRKRADVYFYKGLYETFFDISRRMNVPLTEDMIAFIIAHELSHSLQHTSHEGLDVRDLNKQASPYLIQMIKNGEYDADLRALELMDKAGYSVFGAVDAMTFLEFINKSSQAETVLSSHPYVSLRKQRLFSIILDQKTNVFTNAKAARTPMAGAGRIDSKHIDFRYLMDQSEEDLLRMAQSAENLAALDELTGMLILRKRMNALKGLVNEKQWKAAFLRHVYMQAAVAAIFSPAGISSLPGPKTDYSDMRGAAAIYDFGKRATAEDILSGSMDRFEEKISDIIQEIQELLSSFQKYPSLASVKNQGQTLLPAVRRIADGFSHNDFDGFLLPRAEVEKFIPIFTQGKEVPVTRVSAGRPEKVGVDPKLVEEAVENPRILISAFFYANYLEQQTSLEFGIPTTDMRVRLQRREHALYLENPAYRSLQSVEDRRNMQQIILLHYVMRKTRTTVFSHDLNASFAGIDRFLKIEPEIARRLFIKYYSLMTGRYPEAVAVQLAINRIRDILGFDIGRNFPVGTLVNTDALPDNFLKGLAVVIKKAESEYGGEPDGLSDYISQKTSPFVDSHSLIVFIREAIRKYGDRLPADRVELFNSEIQDLRSGKISSSSNARISRMLTSIVAIYSQEPRQEVLASEVFSGETKLDYYLREGEKIDSLKSLLALPDWAVSDYLNRKSPSARDLLKESLKAGTSIDDIFTFMKTRLAYGDRQKIFDDVFLGYSSEYSLYFLDFLKTKLNNDPKEITVWFLGMFSKKDALKLMDEFCRIILYEKATDVQDRSGAREFRDMTIALIEYVFSQTSQDFHPHSRIVKVYLDLINSRIADSGKAADENYVREAVFNALMILSPAADLDIYFSSPEEVSPDGSPDFKSKKTRIVPEQFAKGTADKYADYKSKFALHYFGWNDLYSTTQSVFVTSLTGLSIDQLRNLLRERSRYVGSQAGVEYRGEVFSLSASGDFFADLLALIILQKISDPHWEENRDAIERLDDIMEISVHYRKEEKGIEISGLPNKTLKIDQDKIDKIPYNAIQNHLADVAIPSSRLDRVWGAYVRNNELAGKFPEIVSLLLSPNAGNEALYNPLGFLGKRYGFTKVSYRQVVKHFFLDSSVYAKLFNAYVELHGRGYVYGKYKSFQERLTWIKKVLPHKSIIKDGIFDLWETDIFPEIIADLPALVRLAREAAREDKDLRDLWTLLGEMGDDVGRLTRLKDQISLSPEKTHTLLDFYTTIIPLTLSPQKITRYGATAYMLWTQLPENVNLGLTERLDALTKFMPEPSVLRDELLMQLANKYIRQLEDEPLVTEKLYSGNLLSRDRDLRTEDFVSETLLHLFGGAKIEDRRDILLWVVGARGKPRFVTEVEDEYKIDFTTLPDDVKLLPTALREKFIEGFMLGDNGVLDPQNDNDRHVMSDFLEQLFAEIFPEGTPGIENEVRSLISRVFLAVMNIYLPYRRVQIIKASAALRLRSDFKTTSTGERLAVFLGVLGPVGIKVAQYLSENETLVPDADMRSSLGTLRHKAPEITKISAVSVLKNEIPLPGVLVREIGDPVGVASIKQVNRGKWLDIEKLSELVIRKARGAEADEVKRKMGSFNAGEMSFSDVVSYLTQKASQYKINMGEATVSVVFKIRRPNIETTLGLDYLALDAVAQELEGTVLKGETLNISDLVQTVKEWVNLEKNFINEVRFHKMLADLDYTWAADFEKQAGVTIAHPKILYQTEALIVEEEIQGVPLITLAPKQQPVTMDDVLDAGYTRAEAGEIFKRLAGVDSRQAHILLSLRKAGFPGKSLDGLTKKMLDYDYGKLRELLRHMLLRQIFVDGVFHADLHQGNILLTPEGKIVMIDRGNVGTLNAEQIEGAKILLKGLSLREKGLIKQGIDRMFLNASHLDGLQPINSRITEKDIQEILDKGYDLKMTMNMISARAVQGAKNTPAGKEFSTFLKAFTQAIWLFPTDLKSGMATLNAMAEYISMSEEEVKDAAEEQAKYFIVQDVNNGGSQVKPEEDMLEIARRIFYKKTAGYFMRSVWRPVVWQMMSIPLKRAQSRSSDMGSSILRLVRTQGRKIIEESIEELIKRQDSEIMEVVRDIVSVSYVEKLLILYVESGMKERFLSKMRAPVVMALFKSSLLLVRPFTRIYVEAAKEWMDTAGRRYMANNAPQMTVRDVIALLSEVWGGDFSDIEKRFEEGRRKSPEESVSPESSARDIRSVNLDFDNIRKSAGEGQTLLWNGISSPIQQNTGGIDFNPNLLELQIEGEGSEFSLPINNTTFEQIQINGLQPVIINITPITNLPVILGTAGTGREPLAFSNN